jgi:hypothetical protein
VNDVRHRVGRYRNPEKEVNLVGEIRNGNGRMFRECRRDKINHHRISATGEEWRESNWVHVPSQAGDLKGERTRIR